MKRILYVETGVSGGGSFASLLLNLAHIDRRHYEPIVVFLNESYYKEQAEALGITTYVIKHAFYTNEAGYRRRAYKFLMRTSARRAATLYLGVYQLIHRRLIRALRVIVSKHNIDIIHLNDNIIRDFFGVLVCRNTGAICVSHLRGAPGRQAYPRRLIARFNRFVFAYIAISQFMWDEWTGYGLDPQKCHVIHNGITPLRVTAVDVRKEFNIGEVKTVICSVGRMVDWKNHLFLIRGFNEYRQRNSSSALLLVGDGGERENLERLVNELGISPYVTFTGQSERAKEILAGCDIFVLPSSDEPFGRVTLEAMALKVPVIATRSGANAEVVRNGETGLLVTLDDIDELCDALEEVAENHEFREKLVENAYHATQKEFHIENCLSAIEGIYAAA